MLEWLKRKGISDCLNMRNCDTQGHMMAAIGIGVLAVLVL